MKEKEFQSELTKLTYDNDITLNPLVMEIASAFMTYKTTVSITRFSSEQFTVDFLKTYKRIDEFTENNIPNYYQAGMKLEKRKKDHD